MSQSSNDRLQFSINESVWLRDDAPADEILSMALEPDITVEESWNDITIKGFLRLTGEYRPSEVQADGVSDFENQTAPFRTIDEIMETGSGTDTLEHHFPIDITIPADRVPNLENLFVIIDSFDYELSEHRHIQLQADIAITGLSESTYQERKEKAKAPVQAPAAETQKPMKQEAPLPTEKPKKPVEAEATVEKPKKPVEAEATVEKPKKPVEAEANVEKPKKPVEAEATVEKPKKPVEAQATVEKPKKPVEAEATVEKPKKSVEAEANVEKPKKSVENAKPLEKTIAAKNEEALEKAPKEKKPTKKGKRFSKDESSLADSDFSSYFDEMPINQLGDDEHTDFHYEAFRKRELEDGADASSPFVAFNETSERSEELPQAGQAAPQTVPEAGQKPSIQKEALQSEEQEKKEEGKSSEATSQYLTKVLAGEEKDQKTRVKICIVQSGESLESISERYHVPVTTLLRKNELSTGEIQAGELLYIPKSSKAAKDE
ncbi:LysM peptidoglycan-binding domain-containing protein [Sporolactobacillus kofuensis]|uniref:LysM peptidoglycan-binding domain-containing protein n=1 Tax=Sporolactobacillus kofuensis TaxID=269672 RepID=A0ABW1WC54_9BACL|nr:LysM peptidoglycan-binding domain-containing protein [Sporolactobacillus kofuensis]MCO7175518.1 LysM peptidoglycan-binding domain-containing protein [Sporolactobacillus kofuensis]